MANDHEDTLFHNPESNRKEAPDTTAAEESILLHANKNSRDNGNHIREHFY